MGGARKRISTLVSASLLTLTAALGGCGTIAYKMGAGNDAFDAASHGCKANAADAAQYQSCMSGKGWAMTDLSSDEEPPPAAPPVEPTAAPAPPSAPVATGPAGLASIAPANSPAPPASPSVTPPAAAPAPTRNVTVQSWWKMGGSPDELQNAIAACAATAGETAPPLKGPISPPLMKCMREKGWHAFGQKPA